MARITDETANLLGLLRAVDGLAASDDPGWCETNRPAVLVAPPVIDLRARTCAHRVFALSGHDNPTRDALQQLADLVDLVELAVPGHLELCEPTTYPLTRGAGTVPAYLLTITASTD